MHRIWSLILTLDFYQSEIFLFNTAMMSQEAQRLRPLEWHHMSRNFSRPCGWHPYITRTARMPAFWGSPPPRLPILLIHIGSHVKTRQCQSYKSKKLHMQHTSWSCLIRCVNMKWIRLVFWKLQSGHDSVHRQKDRQTDDVKPVYPTFKLCWIGGYNQ